MYYKVYVDYLDKGVTKAFLWNFEGNPVGGRLNGVIQLNNDNPISA